MGTAMSGTSEHYREIEQRVGKATSNRIGHVLSKSLTIAIARYHGLEEYLPFKFVDVEQEITENSFAFWYAAMVTYTRSDVSTTVERLQGENAVIDQFAGKVIASIIYRRLK
jgi:hypothetical protein